MPDPFGKLPMPFPLIILKEIEHLSTLHYLLQASHAAAAVFREHYYEITETIVNRSTPCLRKLLRATAVLRTNRSDIKRRLEHSVDPHVSRDYRILGNALALATQQLSDATCSFEGVRRLIDLASRVQQITHLFLNEHLERVNSIRPCQLLDSNYTYSNDDVNRKHTPKFRSYEPAKCGPPSWIEEQRVHRALWRLEIHFCIVDICEQEITRSAFLKGSPPVVWLGQASSWELDELDCVYSFLREVNTTTIPLSKLPSLPQHAITAPQSRPGREAIFRHWHQTPMYLGWRSDGWGFFHSLHIPLYSPLHNSDFKPFRWLGMGFWDCEKLARLGLIHLPPELVMVPNPGLYLKSMPEAALCGPARFQDDLLCRWMSVEKQALQKMTRKEPFVSRWYYRYLKRNRRKD